MSGTASNGSDYTRLSGSVNIAAGSASANVTVNPFDGTGAEGSETVVLTIVSDTAYIVGSPSSATVTIADNDQGIVTVVASDPDASETGPDPGTFRISRGGSTNTALTVRYSMSGTASNGSDYATLSGSMSIPAGSVSANVTVNPVDGTSEEESETVVLTILTNAAYVVGSPHSATVTIADNDGAAKPIVSVVATDVICSEGGPNPGSFTISRSGSTASDLSVTYSLGGTAVNGADYARLSGSVIIRAGNESAAVVVQQIDDRLIEIPELVQLTLTAEDSYEVNLLLGTATLTILDNDLFGLDLPLLVISRPASLPGENKVELAWNSEAGQRYQLQYKSNWNTTNWINLGSVITATNSTVLTSDVAGSDSRRFYRVALLP